MDDAENDVLAFMTFARAHWTQIYSTNPLERLNAEIKRRTNVVGICLNDAQITRLVGAMMLGGRGGLDVAPAARAAGFGSPCFADVDQFGIKPELPQRHGRGQVLVGLEEPAQLGTVALGQRRDAVRK